MSFRDLFKTQKDRLIAITDGVYAIAMTILVLEIAIPTASEITTVAQMDQFIMSYLIPAIVMYLISFYLVATFWENSILIFDFEEIDNKVQNLTLLALSFVCLIPFATGFLFEFWHFKEANIIFSSIILIVSVIYFIMFAVAFKNELRAILNKYDWSLSNLREKIKELSKLHRHQKKNNEEPKYPNFKDQFLKTVRVLFYLIISPIITSIISLILAFFSPYLSILSFILVLLLRTIIRFTNKASLDVDNIDYDELTEEEQKMYKLISNLE